MTSIVAWALFGATAVAAGGPTTRGGQPAQLVASGVATPTEFAFGDGQIFYSDGTPPPPAGIGGVYVIKNGTATRLAGSPAFSFGVAWHTGTLYVSAINQLEAWSGWNGTKFTSQKVIYTAPKGFPAFNGLAFGADGRLYVGVDVGQTNDHGPATAPYQYDLLSMTTAGKQVKVVAKGIRQPWQLAFPTGSSSPYASDLGQDTGATNPPDFVLRVKQGQNYGFPTCNWTSGSPCSQFATPFHQFAPHTDAMGLGILGQRLYISEFGVSTPAQVVSMPLTGGTPRVELSGFPKGRNIVGLGVHNGWVYVGEIAASATQLGAIYRFKAS
jgi:glucose/arabinose dehydrogenase